MDTKNPDSVHSNSVDGASNTMPVKIVYALYAIGCIFPLAALGGVVYAYIERGKNQLNDTHLSHLIATFWVSLLIGFFGVLTVFFGIGVLILIAGAVWYIIRLITGFILLNDNKPVTGTRVVGMIAE